MDLSRDFSSTVVLLLAPEDVPCLRPAKGEADDADSFNCEELVECCLVPLLLVPDFLFACVGDLHKIHVHTLTCTVYSLPCKTAFSVVRWLARSIGLEYGSKYYAIFCAILLVYLTDEG